MGQGLPSPLTSLPYVLISVHPRRFSCSLANVNLKSRFLREMSSLFYRTCEKSSTMRPPPHHKQFPCTTYKGCKFSLFCDSICRQRETKASENALPLPQQEVFVALKR